MLSFTISYPDLIKFPYFADTIERGTAGKSRGLNMFTNTKEVELYDLIYEYSSTLKNKIKKKKKTNS
jgi:hypothetical protein